MSSPPLARLHKSAPLFLLALGLLALQPATARAQNPERAINEPTATAPSVGVETSPPSIYARIWQLPTLYQNKQSNFFNELRFIGRLHLDVYNLDSNLGADQDWIVRRFRLGGKARLFHQLEAQLEVDLNLQDDGSTYNGLTNAYLAWKWSDAVKLTAGKHSVRFTLDGSTSANELLIIDRNNLSKNLWFTEDQIPGVSLSGKAGQWVYNTGLYSGGTRSPEFGDFDAGNFWLGSVGYDFGPQLRVKQALLRADYVFNDVDAKSTFTRPFEQIGSMVFLLELERWGVSADVTAGRGALGQSDVIGAVAMPVVQRHEETAGGGPLYIRSERRGQWCAPRAL